MRREASTRSDPPFPWWGSHGGAVCLRAFSGRVPGSAAARTRGHSLRGVPGGSASHRPNTEVSPGLPGSGRRFQPSPALPAGGAVSTAGFPGAAEGAQSPQRRGGRGRARRDNGQLRNPGGAPTDLAFPPRLASHRSVIPGPRAALPLPFPAGFSFPSFTSSRPIGRSRGDRPSSNRAKLPRGSKIPPQPPLPAHVSSAAEVSREVCHYSPPPHHRVRERERRRALQATALQTPLSSASPLHGRRRRARLPLDCGL